LATRDTRCVCRGRRLDASHYGVPQHRERLILLGAKKGTPLPDYPLLQTNPADVRKPLLGLPYGPTCKDAIGDLPDSDRFPTLLESDGVRTEAFGISSAYARELRCLAGDAWHYGYERRWDPEQLTSSARTAHSEISRRRFAGTPPGDVEPISRFYKLEADGLSNTLRAGTDGARGAFTSPRPIHYSLPRCVTVREMARLHGFPDWFRFHATKWHGARQIGNSVAPPLARAIGLCVAQALKIRPAKAGRILDLGDPGLLSMEMSAAAGHFGVKAPSSRRDRKSGAKKRKQNEIEISLQNLRVVNGQAEDGRIQPL
jgi:DNA (cytosine-5)-methyltransferase 1